MRINLLLISVFLSVIIFAEIDHYSGITGTTKFNNGDGCICHAFESNDSVHVWIEGPDSLVVSDTVLYKIYLTGGPAVAGGFNVATRSGELISVDTTTHVEFGELTHSFPLVFFGDTICWNFSYVSSDTTGTDTIYSVANSVNLDGNPQVGDEWNFGENFAVDVIDNPVGVEPNKQPDQFYLAQNYPNPFNPSTLIKYSVPETGVVKLSIYSLLGEEVAVLVDEIVQAGFYETTFDASNLPSATYIYRLQTGNKIEAKKMILLK